MYGFFPKSILSIPYKTHGSRISASCHIILKLFTHKYPINAYEVENIKISALFSVYLNHSASFGIYGSLTTIIIALLWMYYCMYILLLGSYLNTKF